MHHYLYPKWMKFKEVHAALQKDILKEQRSMNAKEDSISQKNIMYLKRSFRLHISQDFCVASNFLNPELIQNICYHVKFGVFIGRSY